KVVAADSACSPEDIRSAADFTRSRTPPAARAEVARSPHTMQKENSGTPSGHRAPRRKIPANSSNRLYIRDVLRRDNSMGVNGTARIRDRMARLLSVNVGRPQQI